MEAMKLLEALLQREAKLSLVGLGYVGMPIAVAFAKHLDVIGYDANPEKIRRYREGEDPTGEVGEDAIRLTQVDFTSDPARLEEARFHIVAVPTPVRKDHVPDLRPLEGASRDLGRHLKRGSVVVYESTVYPGVTEDVCVPILERESGLRCGVDFKVGYSPERINPGDKVHRLASIVKIVSGMDEETLDTVARVYGLVVEAGIYRASSIKVAEAAKVIENSQRDINIAFMNELSIIFHRIGIDTLEVLQAAGTKWNFLPFRPGLVGGHCIGVDPYYLTYKAEELGYHSQIILSGRRINDDMGKYVAESLVKSLIRHDIPVKGARVTIFGFTFKENCPDTRNTKVIDIVRELWEYGIQPRIGDPVADAGEAEQLYGIHFASMEDIEAQEAVIVAVGHQAFQAMGLSGFAPFYADRGTGKRILFDVKGIFPAKEDGFDLWRL